MQSQQLRANISYVLSTRSRFLPFLEPLGRMSAFSDSLFGLLPGIAKGGDALPQAANSVHQTLASFGKVLDGVNQKNFFRAHDLLVGELEDLWTEVNETEPDTPTEWNEKSREEIDRFMEFYDAFLTDQTPKKALPVVLAAKQLHTQIENSFKLLEAVQQSLGHDDKPKEGEETLSLYLPSELSMHDVINRLQAFQSMYSTLCGLLYVNENEQPLRIVEMESGSLWLKIIGNEKVVSFFASILEKGAVWGFRTFTKEGRLNGFPQKVENIESLFDLTRKLKEAGIDVAAADDNIKLATIALSKDVLTLIQGQSSVTVNKQTISLQNEFLKRQYEEIDRFASLPLHEGRKGANLVLETNPQLPPPTGDGSP